MRRGKAALATAIIALLACAAIAVAAPPTNDNRADAQQVQLGATTNGTTTDATVEEGEPASGCGNGGPSVWYRIDATRNTRAIAFVQASGDLDVVLDVYLRQRSQLSSLSCDASDTRGRAAADFQMRAGQSYLVRVAQRQNSVAGNFSLLVDVAQPAAEPPGRALPRSGADGTVQRVFEPSNAWSARLSAGTTYRVNLASRACVRLAVYRPGTRSFDDSSPIQSKACGGYILFTPGAGASGTYSFQVSANSSRRTELPYHLELGRAGPDDTTPGKFLRNHRRVRGSLNSNHLDVIDLYRFDVVRPSVTDIKLASGSDLRVVLLSAGGRRLSTSFGGVRVRTRRGRYYIAVKAGRRQAGTYRLTRASKTITRTHLSVSPARSGPGQAVHLNVNVPPGVDGPVNVVVERLDPVSGYQFLRRFHTVAHGGHATVTFNPPSVGRYRARARYLGTRDSSGSHSGLKRFRVEEPLQQ
jgi:hypothetical protein